MIKLVLPTHYYEKIIEKLGGNPAELPDRCECTMVDQIVNLIDNGIEGGGGGVFVVNVVSRNYLPETPDKTYDQIANAAKTGPVLLIERGYSEDGQDLGVTQYQLRMCVDGHATFTAPVLNPMDNTIVGTYCFVISSDGQYGSNYIPAQ